MESNRIYRVVLNNYFNESKNKLARMLFKLKCATHGISIEDEDRQHKHLSVYHIHLHDFSKVQTVRHFPEVFSIEEAPYFKPERRNLF